MRVTLVVPGGLHPSGEREVIPALVSLVRELAERHTVTAVVLGQSPAPIEFGLHGARVVDLGARASRLRHARLLALAKGSDVIHAFWAGTCGALAGAVGRALGVPVVLSIGGGELARLEDIGYGSRGKLLVWGSLELAARVTAGSHYARALMPPEREAIWLPLGADARLFRAPLDREEGPPWRLVHVASINRVKDPHLLLHALARLESQGVDFTLDWIGEDTLGGEVQQRAAELGLEARVRFRGFLTQAALAPLLREAHAAVQSSRHESQGVAVLEAACAGAALVGTRVGLLAELAPEAAVVVPPRDSAALAEAIGALLADPARRRALAARAQSFALAHDASWTARRFESLYGALGAR